MRVIVIGATGHVGTYLIPRLSDLGHHTIAISRGNRKPYIEHPAWREVETLNLDRHEYEADGRFGEKIAGLNPDVVIDMICFNRDSAQHLVDSLRKKVQLLITCGTIWIHGPSITVPTSEEENRRPFGEYGVNKLDMTDYLLREARQHGFPATVLHPGHIVG
ncbi:MAG: NAD-dependent epimerase/dehydratase family protein, partial [Candidatus Marinimicrobia bacterium]|nr:NAD-dependent epimerase/dehydratase family protein [Candidatus Neomarinimicrobiota bacterium]